MEEIRKPFQGAGNIIRFNWHFYALSLGLVILALMLNNYLSEGLQPYIYIFCCLVIGITLISLAVSHYVYDRSGLYKLNWLEELGIEGSKTVNINAGFDEISNLLKAKFQNTDLIVLDFYDSLKYTEISIKRARKAYPVSPNTKHVTITNLPLSDKSIDNVLVIFSAHEIRNEAERINFFKELNRVVKPSGQIFITEHLRDLANFFAYNIGFLHFYSKSSWHRIFQAAQLKIQEEIKCTPFISTFILKSHGNTL